MPNSSFNATPTYPDIRYTPQENLVPTLRLALEKACASIPYDFDKAVLLGIKVRQFDRLAIENFIIDFIAKPALWPKIEVSAFFLSSLWSPDSTPNPDLVSMLCDYFDTKPPSSDIQDALILALASAHGAHTVPSLKQRIYQCAQSVFVPGNQQPEETAVINALYRILQA